MTMLPLFRVLTALLIPLGQIGLWVAMVAAIALAIALAVDSAGLAGGGAAVWLTGAILSLGLWYSGDLMAPLTVALVLPAAIGAGLACRWAVRLRPGAVRSRSERRAVESGLRGGPGPNADVECATQTFGTLPREITATGTVLAIA